MPCHVCNLEASLQGHHIVPQASGGAEGPVVDLCASCHQAIHTSAKAARRGGDSMKALRHLDSFARDRALVLVRAIVLAAETQNPHPIVGARLDSPTYLDALKRFQIDNGYTSQEAALNALLRALAVRYGLEDEAQTGSNRVKLSDFRAKSRA